MNTKVGVLIFGIGLFVFLVTLLVGTVLTRHDAHGDVPYIQGVIVPVGDRQIPCVVVVNRYHATNGAGVDCDWTRR